MQLNNAVVFISGANRGLGLAFAKAALARGAAKVYAGARNPDTVTLPGVTPVKLDVTNEQDIAAVAAQCSDVTVLINNAGIAEMGSFLADGAEGMLQRQMNVNVLGPLRLTRAFAPVLAKNGGGAVMNVLSVASWITGPVLATYSATKAAAWSLTNALRQELASQHTHVMGLHAGFIDTDLTNGLDVPKATPQSIVEAAFAGLEQDAMQVLADDITKQVHQALSPHPQVYLVAAQ